VLQTGSLSDSVTLDQYTAIIKQLEVISLDFSQFYEVIYTTRACLVDDRWSWLSNTATADRDDHDHMRP